MDVEALSGRTVDHLPLEAAAVLVAVLGIVLVRRSPRLVFAGWCAVVCFVPVWVSLHVKVDFEPHVVASLALLACLLPIASRRRGGPVPRFTWGDALFLGLVVAGLVAIASGRVTFSDMFVLLVQWTAAYLAGRLVAHRVPLPWVYGTISVVFSVVAALALVEFLTGFNPFVLVPGHNSLHDTWASIQVRGGRPRAEGAFGHSIALGSSLALVVPLAMQAPFRTVVRLGMVVLMIAASVVTFSRIGLVTAVLGAVLSVALPAAQLPARLRLAVAGGMVAVGAGFASLVSSVFSAAGTEATDSADYRLQLLTLIPGLRPFGYASSAYTLPDGHVVLANVASADGTEHSIDNALLLVGLTYGWVPLACVLLLLLGGLWCLLRGRATAPTIAVLAQVPAFATVALITQYSTLAWFLGGLAVFTQAQVRRRSDDAPPIDDAAAPPSPELVATGPGKTIPSLV